MNKKIKIKMIAYVKTNRLTIVIQFFLMDNLYNKRNKKEYVDFVS